MVLFRNGVRQALRRAGYHASFVCRPPFPNVMASGWHLHQSLVDRDSGGNAFVRDAPRRRQQRRRRRAHALGRRRALARRPARARPRRWRRSARRRSTPTRAFGRTRWRRSRSSGAATTAARCCACSAAAAIRRRGSRTASASRWPTRTSTSRRRSTPASTASSDVSPRRRRSGAPYAGSGEALPTSLGEALDALAGRRRARARVHAAGRRLVRAHQAVRARAPRRRRRFRRLAGARVLQPLLSVGAMGALTTITVHLLEPSGARHSIAAADMRRA